MFVARRLLPVAVVVTACGAAPAAAPPRIDVLFAHTPAAVRAAGSVGAVRAGLAEALAAARQAFRSSGVLVESAGLVALDADPPGRTVKQQWCVVRSARTATGRALGHLRDAAGADLVCVIAGRAGGPDRGHASVPSSPEALARGDAAFSVVRVTELRAGDLSLAHELGHNLGCSHAHAFECWERRAQVGSIMLPAPRTRLPVFSRASTETIRRNAPRVARYR